ncbi:MAG: LPS export ABC transporter permease LptF [Bdellovibrio sp.]|nr:MAG: LPS export ABC transporter permease LptF [Bdellovibrio sp.]
MLKSRIAFKYIFFELIPPFLMGIGIFIFIILMFQSFRLMEYILIHGAGFKMILQILFYMSISFLPFVLPMSLLFSILITYGRMNNDSEIIAFRSIGLSFPSIIAPAFTLALITTFLSLQVSFQLAPWGNRQSEVLIHKLAALKPGTTIKSGVFSEGFFNLVVYTNKVDSRTGWLKDVFIYDERNPQNPMAIVAPRGKLVTKDEPPIYKAFLRLYNGNIHRPQKNIYTKIDFETYDIFLEDAIRIGEKQKTLLSLTIQDLYQKLKNPSLPENEKRLFAIEYHRRWALSFACLIFALMGASLGSVANKRSGKSSGFVLSIGVVVLYWSLYMIFEGLGKSGWLPVSLSAWSTNILLGTYSFYTFKKHLSI